jgi:hypothetical protein
MSNLFNSTFTKEQVDFVLSLFEVGAPTPFSRLNVGEKFFLPGTKSLNRFGGYMSPILCRKESSDSLMELMTDFPVVAGTVPPESLDYIVYPVRLNHV